MPSVLLLGATGLVGSQVVTQAVAEPGVSALTVLARREAPAGVAAPKLSWRKTDVERLDAVPDAFAVDAIVCALGTTIRQAGSQQRFRAVDYDIPLAAARLGKERGVRHYVLVSSLGADARSRVFYSRVKGELEDAVLDAGFAGVTILRPSLLLGDRAEFRLGEALFKGVSRLVPGKYQGIEAADVARCAVRAVVDGPKGEQILESDALRAWARTIRGERKT